MAVIFQSAFPRGNAPIRRYGTLEDSAGPVVRLFMNGFGPTLDGIAERLVGEGYRVLLPDLFCDHLPYAALNPQSVLSGGEDRQGVPA